MQRGMKALRSSEAKGKPPCCAVFFTKPFIRGDYFVRKEALVQLCVGCVGRYKSRTGSTRIADLNKNSTYCCMPHS